MSGVRGSCVFCAHWPASGGCLLPGYACLDHEPDKPQWSPTLAAQIALRLEEDLADARAELERNSAADLLIENARLAQALRNEQDGHHPEERVGRCWCGCYTWGEWSGDTVELEIVESKNEPNIAHPQWCSDLQRMYECAYCPDCGAQLCADGNARRNADTARVQRVRKLLDTPVPRGVPGAPSPYMQPGIEFAIKKVRAALDEDREVRGDE